MASQGKKKVLVMVDWFLPGDKAGGPVRSCANLIEHLRGDFEFSVITRDTDYTSNTPYAGIQSNRWNDSVVGVKVFYISDANLNKETIARLLTETTYDHVYLNGVWSQPFSVWPIQFLKKNKPKVKVTLAVRGMLASSALAIKSIKKKLYLAYAKWTKLYADVIFHATNEKELGEVKSVFGSTVKVMVAGNLPRRTEVSELPLQGRASKNTDGITVISIARIAPEKNTLGAIRILRLIKCNATVHFWGAVYDESYFQVCKQEVKSMPANVKVIFHGATASSQVRKLLSEADVLLMPTLGENFGHVILESLQVGTPVLISDQTPWRNLESQFAGWDLPLTNEARFAKCLDDIEAMSDGEFQKWVTGAMNVANKYTNDSELIKANRRLFTTAY